MAEFLDYGDMGGDFGLGNMDFGSVDAGSYNPPALAGSDASEYFKTLKGNGAGIYDQPDANWQVQSTKNPDFYGNLYNLFGGEGSKVLDWSKLGYGGPTVGLSPGERDSGGDYQPSASRYQVPDEFKQFVDSNKYGYMSGMNKDDFSLSQLTQNGKAIKGANYSESMPNQDGFNAAKLINMIGMAYGGSLAAAGGGGGEGAAMAADGATAGSSGGGFSLEGLGSYAGRGAASGAMNSAANGGDIGDIFKGAGTGALAGGIGYGVGTYNPGSYVTDNTGYQGIINRGITGGVNAGLQGNDVGTGALMGAGQQAGNYFGGQAWNSLTSPQGGGDMPYDNTMPDIGTLGGTIQDPYGESSVSYGGDYTPPWQQQANLDVSGYGGQPERGSQPQEQGNPLISGLMKSLGIGGGSSSPKFGDMAGSLMGIYSAYQNKKKLGGLADNLSSMFGPNSPYAQQLGTQLARRDAAAGRRSQYGPREVELQARLAEMNSRNAPTLQALYGAETQNRDRMLGAGLRFGQQSGAFGALGNYASPWLNNIFNQTPANSGPQLED